MHRILALALTSLLAAVPSLAIGQTSQSAHYWAKEGYKHQQKKDFAEAEKCYKKSLEFKADDPNVHANLTIVYLGAKRYADLIKSADEAVRLGTKLSGVYLNRADGYRLLAGTENDKEKQKKMYEQAISNCEMVLDHKKHYLKVSDKRELAYAHAILSHCHKNLGNGAEAQKHFDKAVELDPTLKDQ